MDLSEHRILVAGALGMLGRDVCAAFADRGAELILSDAVVPEIQRANVASLDITDACAVSEFIGKTRPHWVINCAAYTNVDGAESNYAAAFQINSLGPANLARAAKENSAALLHVSSDYVFGAHSGDRSHLPWKEADPLAPCGLYGFSKCFGDQFTAAIAPEDHLIVRTSWLHGIHGPNFLATMLRLGKERDEIKVVNDQIGSPTWSRWLAQTMVKLVAGNARGVFHACSRGNISWFDFAVEIFRQAKIEIRVLPQTSAELGRPAPRPPFSTLDVSKLENCLGLRCPDWQEGITAHLRELAQLSPAQAAAERQ